ncbi:ABC transporter ATP-binding protein [Patescibacteria group bacterium]|nr:ABC transporter ATP-binding protein [Patescibacteria group bacterium]
MPQEPTLIIDVQQVDKTFSVKAQNVQVLRNVSLSVYRGDFIVLFGPSGCGKSTLLHIVLGLESPTRGRVKVLGRSLYEQLDEDERADFRKQHVGMVYQQPNWIKALTVKENIMFGLRLSGLTSRDAEPRANAVLQLVGMQEWQDYIPTELSSGQQQKVALARAIVTNPDVIIADEPTGNLDFESGQELMTLISTLNNQGKTIIMVTHDLEYLAFARRAIQMFDGQVVQEIDDPAAYVQHGGQIFKRSTVPTTLSL